jgi:hypothetical protein
MGEKNNMKEKQDKDKEQIARVTPIHPGDRRGHGKRHLLDTCK